MPSSSRSNNKSSTVHVAQLHRLPNGKYQVIEVDGADKRHYAFFMKFYNALTKTTHGTSGVTRQQVSAILSKLYPDGKYILYYNRILRSIIVPRILF
jgi:hypothetical protein